MPGLNDCSKKIKSFFIKNKRYLWGIKAMLLGLLPLLCCLVTCALQNRSILDTYLPMSEWNDELFYFKQVEGIIHYGFPQGYFGFNESHALSLSFAAWSPVLVFPWIIWGILFGWNFLSPVICNILLLTVAVILFVLLTKPDNRQLGVMGLLFCLYTPFVRYMLSGMPEIICFSLLIIFYGIAINYVKEERAWKLVLLFVLSGLMTLMRPYLLLFMMLPVFLWIRKQRWIGLFGSVTVCGGVLVVYALIKHYLGAEYFAPLFFTDWVDAFFEKGIFGGVYYTLSKLKRMGVDFAGHTVRGFKDGLASGAFFGGYLVMFCVFVVYTLGGIRQYLPGIWKDIFGKKSQNEAVLGSKRSGEEASAGILPKENRNTKGSAGGTEIKGSVGGTETKESAGRIETKGSAGRTETKEFAVWLMAAHMAFSFFGMFVALLLMYKLTEGSKHLLTFMAAGIFIISLMKTKTFKKAAFVGAAFLYLYSYKAVDPYDYQVPFATAERKAQMEAVTNTLADKMVLCTEQVPNFENSVIWVLNDKLPEGYQSTRWQALYGIPEGFGISCCYPDYVNDHFDTLKSRYIALPTLGELDTKCREAGYTQLYSDSEITFYQRY